MSIDITWFNHQVDQFAVELPRYEEYAKVLRKLFELATQSIAPQAIVQVRAKSISSFAEKCLRKQKKYSDPVHQLTDLCGARIITHTKAEVDRFCEFIRECCEIDEANSLDLASLLRPTEFGYRSKHFVIYIPRSGWRDKGKISIPVPDNVYDLKAEVQVRTIAQHCWADIGHDRIYKSPFKVPAAWEHETSKISAFLEQVDDAFQNFTERVDIYRTPGADNPYMEPEKVLEEIKLLESVLARCPKDASLAHRLSRLLLNRQEWDRAIEYLEPHQNTKDSSILYCLGYAWWQKHLANPQGVGIEKGRDLLDQAVRANEKHVEALLASAEASRESDEDKSRERYLDAFQKAPSDPRALAAYVRLKATDERNLNFVPLIRASLDNAIARCKDQVAVGLNLPSALYSIGEFNLLLDRPYDSLTAYAQAIQRSNAEYMIDAALKTIEILRVVREQDPKRADYLDWVRRLLLLAKSAKFHGGALDDRLKPLVESTAELTGPVVIVAGGCDINVEKLIAAYRPQFENAFRDFRGTVISGGTVAGISGLVGGLKDAYPGRITTVGYVPKYLPSGVILDNRYDKRVETKGTDFSPLQPLQNWIDILAAGIAPASVRLLGINGGNISAFEYRLAAALGARVGLLRGSEGKADELIKSRELGTLGLSLPDDPYTLRLFIGPAASISLPEDDRDRLGRYIHDRYRAEKQKQSKPHEPSMADWPALSEPLKESNRQQADNHQELLRAAGMKAEAAGEGECELIRFSPEEIERMAEIEHARWNVERLLGGTTYGPDRDDKKGIHPSLVSWADLPDDVREWDRRAVRDIPEVLKKVGLTIRRIAPGTA